MSSENTTPDQQSDSQQSSRGGFDIIGDIIPARTHDSRDADSDGSVTRDMSGQSDLVTPDQTLGDRLTPNSRLGWLGYFAGFIIAFSLLLWLWPLIPPWLKTMRTVLVLGFITWSVWLWLHTRHQMLDYWDQYDQFDIYFGDDVRTIVGRTADADGDGIKPQELDSVGYAGLSPSYRTVADEYTTDEALLAKVDRREPGGDWEPAQGFLDRVYTAASDTVHFGTRYVTHARRLQETERAPDHEWATEPPDRPDKAAVTQLITRDRSLREEIVPSYQDRLEVKDDRVQKLLNEATSGDPRLSFDELAELLVMLSVTQNGSSSHDGGVSRNGDLGSVDERVAEQLADIFED